MDIFISNASSSNASIWWSTISSFISGVAAVTSAVVAIKALRLSMLRPGELTGMCNLLKVASNPRKMILPSLWIQNIGGKPILIEDIKICFKRPTTDAQFPFYPTIRDTNTKNEHLLLSEIENKQGALFEGFVLKSNETWRNIFSFDIAREKDYDCFKGEWTVFVQVKQKGEPWATLKGSAEQYIFPSKGFFGKGKKLTTVYLPIKYSNNREYFTWKA